LTCFGRLATATPSMSPNETRSVRAWLLSLWALTMLMVMIGGITRLTGSGLSITEWRPITGALPPIGAAAWQEAFAEYQRSPQFLHQNSWMTLGDFQRIFFWEFVHRLFGRLLGFAFVLPWVYFMWKGRLSGPVARRTFSVLLLGGLQGAVGWFMVKSGLVNEPRVSHYRLAMHLLLGVGVGQWILWQALDLLAPRSPAYALSGWQRRCVQGLFPLLVLQLVYGAFMAGTRAGYVSATFPDMNGHYAPQAFFSSEWRGLFDNPLTIHYLHRALGFGVLAYSTFLAVALRRTRIELRAAAYLVLAATLGQLTLGALTVVLHMPIALAVAHQAGAYVLCSSAFLLLHAALGAAPAPAADSGTTQATPAVSPRLGGA
jgi:cytochrome c oxidase assembly protein subunit 15